MADPMTFEERMEVLSRFHIDAEMRHDREMAESRVRMAELEASQRKTEATLRWAIRLSVEDARRQRKRNAEFDKLHAESAKQYAESAKRHAELQEWLNAFLKRGGNGNPGSGQVSG